MYLIAPSTSNDAVSLRLKLLTLDAILLEPAQREAVKRRVPSRGGGDLVVRRPDQGLLYEFPETHVNDVCREGAQAVKDVSRIWVRGVSTFMFVIMNEGRCTWGRESMRCRDVHKMVAFRFSLSSLRKVRRASRTRTSRSTVT